MTDEQLNKLIQDCSRHRGRHSPYRSPNHFWDIDFPASQEKDPVKKVTKNRSPIRKTKNGTNAGNKPCRKLQLELSPISKASSTSAKVEKYQDWAADIDSNSRQSNVLHSTKIS